MSGFVVKLRGASRSSAAWIAIEWWTPKYLFVKKIAWAYTVPQLMLLFLLTLFFWKALLPINLSLAAAYGAVVLPLVFVRLKAASA
jgi:hypothetical protein